MNDTNDTAMTEETAKQANRITTQIAELGMADKHLVFAVFHEATDMIHIFPLPLQAAIRIMKKVSFIDDAAVLEEVHLVAAQELERTVQDKKSADKDSLLLSALTFVASEPKLAAGGVLEAIEHSKTGVIIVLMVKDEGISMVISAVETSH